MNNQSNLTGDVNMPSSSSVFGLPNQLTHAISIPGAVNGGAFANRRSSVMAPSLSQSPPQAQTQARRRSSMPSTPPSVDVLMDDSSAAPQFPNPNYHTNTNTPSAKVMTRPVTRRQNLLPKSKNFNRVQDQLRVEKAPQQTEVISEANVQRLLQSAPCSPLLPRTPRSKHSHSRTAAAKRTAGRFPESYVDEDDLPAVNSSSGESESEETHTSTHTNANTTGGEDMEMSTSDPSDTSAAMRPPLPSQRVPQNTSLNAWLEFRDPGNPTKASPGGRLSQGNIFDVDAAMNLSTNGNSPGVSTPHLSGKAPKRKLTETDRYEPYAYNSMKRRAVSPSLSVGSPALTQPAQTPTQPSFKTKRSNSSHHTSRSSSPQLSTVVAAASTPGKGSGMGYGTTALGLAASSGMKWGNDNVGVGAGEESALETGSSYTSEEAVKGRSEGVDGISRMSLG